VEIAPQPEPHRPEPDQAMSQLASAIATGMAGAGGLRAMRMDTTLAPPTRRRSEMRGRLSKSPRRACRWIRWLRPILGLSSAGGRRGFVEHPTHHPLRSSSSICCVPFSISSCARRERRQVVGKNKIKKDEGEERGTCI
jgi:hypothetical protein